MLHQLKTMHDMGYVHNDLKLDNILIGAKDPKTIYLIDFGLSCSYLNADGQHVEKEYIQKFSGNFIFASLNSCRGYNKSRRDDMQSLIYVMVFMLNGGSLPWSDFHKKFKDRDFAFKDFLRERVDIKYMREFFKQVPQSLREIVKKVLTLQFDEKPPYDELERKIRQECKKLPSDINPITGKRIDHNFEWTMNHAERLKSQLRQQNQRIVDNTEHQYLAIK